MRILLRRIPGALVEFKKIQGRDTEHNRKLKFDKRNNVFDLLPRLTITVDNSRYISSLIS